MRDQTIHQKIQRIQVTKNKPRVMDLFSGCGGISLGFSRAGFKISGSVEYNPHASKSHAINFHSNCGETLFEKHVEPKDITEYSPEKLISELELGSDPQNAIDIIVGGPPCQAFSRVGRAKLRDVAQHPDAYLNDARSSLYQRYLEYVKVLKPIGLLMENVPDILNYGGKNVAEDVCIELEKLGYNCQYTLLNSVFFGVPQMRERMILIAFHEDLKTKIEFPKPTHWINLPTGYIGTRNAALKVIRKNKKEQPLFGIHHSHYRPLDTADNGTCKPAVTVEDAISDLPIIQGHLNGKIKRGTRRFTEILEYSHTDLSKLSSYQQLMRTWPCFENLQGIKDHVIRFLPRDYKIFAKMKPGDQYPEAYKVAVGLFEEKLRALRESGEFPDENSEAFKQLRKEYSPPYEVGKFPNKWRKIEPDQPSRTLLAHLGKDGYSHIHYSDSQARTISVREAARLQSFPDGFIFSGTMNPAFQQIGNAVPPLLAYAIALEFKKALKSPKNEKKTSHKTVNSI